jgi:pyroglutamyl-peptidase
MNRPKRILIYGFGPYRQFRDNITARILRFLPRQPRLKKIVFPVHFRRKQFVQALNVFKPDIILGLGQSSRRRIEVETQAVNRRRARPSEAPKRISRDGPGRIRTTLRLKIGKQASRSVNAGDYVCNFSMYVMLDHIRRKDLNIPYGFVHIPHDHDEAKAGKFVAKLLRYAGARPNSSSGQNGVRR